MYLEPVKAFEDAKPLNEKHEKLRKFAKLLRTTTIPQARFVMHYQHSYCALGVAMKSMGGTRMKFSEVSVKMLEKNYGINQFVMSEIMYMNDLQGLSFKEIADKIEQRIKDGIY